VLSTDTDIHTEIYRIVSSKALDAGEVAPFSPDGHHRLDVTKPAETPAKDGKCC
jgi:Ras-related protein Rab-11A